MDTAKLSQIIEAALLAAGRPLSTKDFVGLFGEAEQPQAEELDVALKSLEERHGEASPLELVKVSSGHRLQVRSEYSAWVSRLWEERTPRYSRAFMETLSIIAYRQPVTRGDIEDIRGVSVSSTIMRTLLDRRWVRAVGHRDVPGRPALYGTTREFLDYFGLASLSDLPELEELRDLDQINVELDFGEGAANAEGASSAEGLEEASEADPEGGDATEAPPLATVTPIRPGALEEADEGDQEPPGEMAADLAEATPVEEEEATTSEEEEAPAGELAAHEDGVDSQESFEAAATDLAEADPRALDEGDDSRSEDSPESVLVAPAEEELAPDGQPSPPADPETDVGAEQSSLDDDERNPAQ